VTRRVTIDSWRWLGGLVLLGLLGLPWTASAQDGLQRRWTLPTRGPVTLTVDLPVGPVAMVPGGIPVLVTMRLTAAVRGELRLQLGTGTPIVLPIDAGEGTYHYEWRVPCDADADADAGTQGLVLTLQRFDASDEPIVFPPLAVATAGRRSRELAETNLSVVWLSERPVSPQFRGMSPLGLDSLYMPPRYTPRQAEVLRGYDVIVVTDNALALLEMPQVEALLTWVRRGGRLVIAADATREEAEAKEALTALAVDIGPERRQNAPLRIPKAALGVQAYYEDGHQSRAEAGEDWVWTVKARPIALQGRACTVAQLERSRVLGFGRIVVTPVNLYDAILMDAEAETQGQYYRHEPLAWLVYRLAGQNYRRARVAIRQEEEGRTMRRAERGEWRELLVQRFRLEPISRGVVGGYLLLFACLVTVGDRLVLRLLRRHHWTWLTTVVVIVGFAFAARWISRMSRGWDDRRRSITIQDYAIDGSTAVAYLDAVMPSARRQFAVSIPPGGAVQMRAQATDDPGLLRLNPVGSDATLEAQAPVWTPYLLAVQHPGPRAEPPFAADLRWQDGSLSGDIALATDAEASAVALFYRGTRYSLRPASSAGRWIVVAPMALPDGSLPRVAEAEAGEPTSGSAYDQLLRLHHFYATALPPPDLTLYNLQVELNGHLALAPLALRGSTEDDDVAWIVARSSSGPRLQISPSPGAAEAEYIVRQLVPVTVIEAPASPGEQP